MKINKEDEFESKYFKKDLLKYKKEYNVSVIVPNYNNEKYLDRRLKTILNQTILPYEIIIIDDKSRDNSLIVINNNISEFKNKKYKN